MERFAFFVRHGLGLYHSSKGEIKQIDILAFSALPPQCLLRKYWANQFYVMLHRAAKCFAFLLCNAIIGTDHNFFDQSPKNRGLSLLFCMMLRSSAGYVADRPQPIVGQRSISRVAR